MRFPRRRRGTSTTVGRLGLALGAAASCLLAALPATSSDGATATAATTGVVVSALPVGYRVALRTATPMSVTKVLARPAWWTGSCDAGHWNSVAVAKGFRRPDHPTQPIVAAHPLTASYLGVPVCGPFPGRSYYYSWYARTGTGAYVHKGRWFPAPEVMWTMRAWGYPEFYCTELAFRFMRLAYGVRPYAAAGGTVVQLYSRATDGGGLLKYANPARPITPTGKPRPVPRPGDVISFKAANSWFDATYLGHAAVVAASSVSTLTGTGDLKLLTQNDTASGWRWVHVYHWHISAIGSGYATLYAWGWLHDPLNRAA